MTTLIYADVRIVHGSEGKLMRRFARAGSPKAVAIRCDEARECQAPLLWLRF
jgi:hypothetical protein